MLLLTDGNISLFSAFFQIRSRIRRTGIKKKAPAVEKILKYSKDFDGYLKDVEVMKLAGISRNTYYKYKKELLAEKP